MRELKFRAFDLKSKEIKQVDNIYFYNQEDENGNLGEVSLVGEKITKYFGNGNLKQVEIMQYIGLKDKNGKEIYEGDILRLYNEEYDNYELFIEVIFNYKACFWGKKIKNNTDDLGESDILYNYNLDITEIIGNIYENPNLLNK